MLPLHIDDATRLLAAIFRRAIKDAKHGDADAQRFLDEYLPQWRRIEKETEKPKHDDQ